MTAIGKKMLVLDYLKGLDWKYQIYDLPVSEQLVKGINSENRRSKGAGN